ncbi:AAA family ATPase [Streptomyces boninensis]|uniref:AAA family ATPase n=1 Tax=Streptomyces boninensis TaxID=2039455 RepID=UPI003B221E9A
MPGHPERPLYGRTRELAELLAALTEGGPRTVEVTGFAGVGKTALARAVALRAGRDTGWPVHWATGPPPAATAGGPAPAGRREPPLVVLDDPADRDPAVEAVAERWPRARILVTGRAPGGPADHRLALAPLGPEGPGCTDPAYELMLAAVCRIDPSVPATAADAPRIAEIARLLDDLPRSLEAAAHWFPLAPPAELLAAARAQPLLLTEPPWRQGGRPGCVAAAAHAIASLSAPQLRLLSWAARRPLPWKAADAQLSRWEAGQAVRELLARGLVCCAGPDHLRLLTAASAAVSDAGPEFRLP